MNGLEKAIITLQEVEVHSRAYCPLSRIDARAKLIVTILFIIAVLLLPLSDPLRLLLFVAYPLVTCSLSTVSYGKVFLYSLVVVPFAVAIGIFNPFISRETVFYLGPVAVSQGWAMLITIIIRSLLAAQAVLILIFSTGFNGVCRGMEKLGVPKIFSTLLFMVYRYLTVLLQEAINMDRARRARGFGRKHYPLKLWGTFIGQLLVRSIHRAECIDRAMKARGFDGTLPPSLRWEERWNSVSWLYMAGWTTFFILAWFLPPDRIFAYAGC